MKKKNQISPTNRYLADRAFRPVYLTDGDFPIVATVRQLASFQTDWQM